mgnify:CR=1 FL=1
MASMRVHELAKEFDMSSKELLDKLQQMKIPAKSHASMLADAYVDKIRSFVLKFEKLGLIKSTQYGNRMKYAVRVN